MLLCFADPAPGVLLVPDPALARGLAQGELGDMHSP